MNRAIFIILFISLLSAQNTDTSQAIIIEKTDSLFVPSDSLSAPEDTLGPPMDLDYGYKGFMWGTPKGSQMPSLTYMDQGQYAPDGSVVLMSGNLGNERVFIYSGKKKTNLDPLRHAISMEKEGAGELLLNCINRDGTFSGLDLGFLRKVNLNVSIPVIGAGGLGRNSHIFDCFNKTDISAIAAGSFFVFHGKLNAVLISYPTKAQFRSLV